MQNTYQWRVIPSERPTVIRSCPKCGSHSIYECSGNFRVNANQNLIDVWLIYQCKKCKNTWNMEILSRVNRDTIEKELYHKFLCNEPELSDYYAFDAAVHRRNKSVPNFDSVICQIRGERFPLDGLCKDTRLEILCDYSMDIRLEKVLCDAFGLSRSKLRSLCDSGCISAEDINDISKAKIKNRTLIKISSLT